MSDADQLPVDSSSSVQETSPASPPRWLTVLGTLAIIAAASQLVIFSKGATVTLADLGMGAAFVGMLYVLWRKADNVSFPFPVLVFVCMYTLAALCARSGRGGAIETAQRIEQIFCGVLLFAFLAQRARTWLVAGVGIGLALNVAVSLPQVSTSFGPAVKGLFDSRMALGFYLVVALCWSLPHWWQWATTHLKMGACILAVAVTLGCVAHGQMLLIGTIGVLFLGFSHSKRAAIGSFLAVAILLLSLAASPGRAKALGDSLSPFSSGGVQQAGEVKQAHAESVAATRMARDYPWFGVGAGHYQQHIGPYYRELPNPNVNAVERDTQAGYGILAGTMGFTTLAVFAVVMLFAVAHGIRAHHCAALPSPMHLSGAVALLMVALGSTVSDPFVRGVGWYVGLGFASAFAPASPPTDYNVLLSVRKIIGWGVALGCLVALTFLIPSSAKPQQFVHIVDVPDQPATPPVTVSPTALAPATGTQAFVADIDFFRVIDAAEAKTFTAPMIADKDPKAAKATILRIPDEKGKPPEGEEPAMKYGGATFELDVAKPLKCRIWVRVYWEGSCGNSMYVRPTEGAKALVVGNDGTYDVWHWLALPQEVELQAGTTTISILNREDGIRFDQILVTGDLQYIPQGIEQE